METSGTGRLRYTLELGGLFRGLGTWRFSGTGWTFKNWGDWALSHNYVLLLAEISSILLTSITEKDRIRLFGDTLRYNLASYPGPCACGDNRPGYEILGQLAELL